MKNTDTDNQTAKSCEALREAGSAQPENSAGYSENFDASKCWKAYNKGCDHRAYKFAGEHVPSANPAWQWTQWSEDERKAYLRGYNGQFINSEAYKGQS